MKKSSRTTKNASNLLISVMVVMMAVTSLSPLDGNSVTFIADLAVLVNDLSVIVTVRYFIRQRSKFAILAASYASIAMSTLTITQVTPIADYKTIWTTHVIWLGIQITVLVVINQDHIKTFLEEVRFIVAYKARYLWLGILEEVKDEWFDECRSHKNRYLILLLILLVFNLIYFAGSVCFCIYDHDYFFINAVIAIFCLIMALVDISIIAFVWYTVIPEWFDEILKTGVIFMEESEDMKWHNNKMYMLVKRFGNGFIKKCWTFSKRKGGKHSVHSNDMYAHLITEKTGWELLKWLQEQGIRSVTLMTESKFEDADVSDLHFEQLVLLIPDSLNSDWKLESTLEKVAKGHKIYYLDYKPWK